MSESSQVPVCPSCAITLEELRAFAVTPELQMRNLGLALRRFEEDPSWDNAELFVRNADLVWSDIYVSWHSTPEARRKQWLGIYLDQSRRGIELLKRVETDRVSRKAKHLANCDKWLRWSEILHQTGDFALVDRQMEAEVRAFLERAEKGDWPDSD